MPIALSPPASRASPTARRQWWDVFEHQWELCCPSSIGERMLAKDLILVSVDDHVCEPEGMFKGHVPTRYRDLAPSYERRMTVVSSGGMATYPAEASVSMRWQGSHLSSLMLSHLGTTRCEPGALMCTRGSVTCLLEVSSEV